jgi:hypothetical protein
MGRCDTERRDTEKCGTARGKGSRTWCDNVAEEEGCRRGGARGRRYPLDQMDRQNHDRDTQSAEEEPDPSDSESRCKMRCRTATNPSGHDSPFWNPASMAPMLVNPRPRPMPTSPREGEPTTTRAVKLGLEELARVERREPDCHRDDGGPIGCHESRILRPGGRAARIAQGPKQDQSRAMRNGEGQQR